MTSQPQTVQYDNHSEQPPDTEKVGNRNITHVPIIIVQEAESTPAHSPAASNQSLSEGRKEQSEKSSSPAQSQEIKNAQGNNATPTHQKQEQKVEETKPVVKKSQETNQQQSQQIKPQDKASEQEKKPNEQIQQGHSVEKSEAKAVINQENKVVPNSANPKDEKKVDAQIGNKDAGPKDKTSPSTPPNTQQQNMNGSNQAVVPREQLLQHHTEQNQKEVNEQKMATTSVPAQVNKTTVDNVSQKDERKSQELQSQKPVVTGTTTQANQSVNAQPQPQVVQQKEVHNSGGDQQKQQQQQTVVVPNQDSKTISNNANLKDEKNGKAVQSNQTANAQPQNPQGGNQSKDQTTVIPNQDNKTVSNSTIPKEEKKVQDTHDQKSGNVAQNTQIVNAKPQENAQTSQLSVQNRSESDKPKQSQSVVPSQDTKSMPNITNPKDEKKVQGTPEQKPATTMHTSQSGSGHQPDQQKEANNSKLDRLDQPKHQLLVMAQNQDSRTILNTANMKEEEKAQEHKSENVVKNNQSVIPQPQNMQSSNQQQLTRVPSQDNKNVPNKEDKKITEVQDHKSGGMMLQSNSQFVGGKESGAVHENKQESYASIHQQQNRRNEFIHRQDEDEEAEEEEEFTHRNNQHVQENKQKEKHNISHHDHHDDKVRQQNPKNLQRQVSKDRRTMERIPSDHSEGYYGYPPMIIESKSKGQHSGKQNIFHFPDNEEHRHQNHQNHQNQQSRGLVKQDSYKNDESYRSYMYLGKNGQEKGQFMHREFSLGNPNGYYEPKSGAKENHQKSQGEEYYPVITSDLFGHEDPKAHGKKDNEQPPQKREVSPATKLRRKNDIEEHIRQHKIHELKKNKKTLEDKLLALDEQLFELEKADHFDYYTSPRKISYDKYKQEKKEELLEKKRKAQEFAKRMVEQKREMENERQRRRDLKENQLLRELGVLQQKQRDELELLKMEEKGGKSNLEKELEKVREKYSKQDGNVSVLEEKKKELKSKRDFSVDNADKSYINQADVSRDRSSGKSRTGRKYTVYRSPILNQVLRRDEEKKLVEYEKMTKKRDLYEKRLEYGREVKATFLPKVRVFDYERKMYGAYNAQNIELHMQGYMAKAYAKKPEPVHRYQSKATYDSFSKEPAEQEMNIKTNYSKGVDKKQRHYSQDENDNVSGHEKGSQSNLDWDQRQEDVSYEKYKKPVSYTGRERNRSVQPQRKITSDLKDYSRVTERVRVGDPKGHNISMDQRYYEDENMDLKHQLQSDQLILREKIGTMLSDIKRMELQIKQKEELLIKDIERKKNEIEY